MSEQVTEIEEGPDESSEVSCANCGQCIEESDAIEVDGDPHCDECVTGCERCGSSILRDDACVTHGEEILCDNCAWNCGHCGQFHSRDETRYMTRHGRAVCESCREDEYTECEDCGDLISNDYAVVRDCGAYCSECAEERDESNVIGSYHSSRRHVRPLPSPFTRALAGRFFGVELEVEATGDRDAAADKIDAWVNGQANTITADGHTDRVLYFEEDGSLDDGFEMISAPMGLDDHSRLWKTVLTPSLTKGLKSHDTTTCGLHVHVSRATLSDLQISKIVCFVNDPDNRRLIESVARRYDSGYCHVSEKKLGTAHRDNGNRYQAVNLCNARTIEFRIFKGTLRYGSVMAALELCNAIVSFCDSGSGAGFNLKTPAFLDFVNSAAMRKHTAYLRMYLSDKLAGVTFPAGFRPVNL